MREVQSYTRSQVFLSLSVFQTLLYQQSINDPKVWKFVDEAGEYNILQKEALAIAMWVEKVTDRWLKFHRNNTLSNVVYDLDIVPELIRLYIRNDFKTPKYLDVCHIINQVFMDCGLDVHGR